MRFIYFWARAGHFFRPKIFLPTWRLLALAFVLFLRISFFVLALLTNILNPRGSNYFALIFQLFNC